MTYDEFVSSFEDSSLPVEGFHHAGQVRMAFLHLGRYPPWRLSSAFLIRL